MRKKSPVHIGVARGGAGWARPTLDGFSAHPRISKGHQQMPMWVLLDTPRQKSIRALEIFRVQKLILNATS